MLARATDTARQRDVDWEVSRGRSRGQTTKDRSEGDTNGQRPKRRMKGGRKQEGNIQRSHLDQVLSGTHVLRAIKRVVSNKRGSGR